MQQKVQLCSYWPLTLFFEKKPLKLSFFFNPNLHFLCISSVLSNEALSVNLSSRLDGLTIEIHKALNVLTDRTQPGTNNNNDAHVSGNLEACVRSAGKLVSSAASIISARSVSGSQGGSLFQEPLSEQQMKRVEQWIQNGRSKSA